MHCLDLWLGFRDLEGFDPDFWPVTAHGDDEQRHIRDVLRSVNFHHWAYYSTFNPICVFFSFFFNSPPDLLERHVCGSESGSTIKSFIVWAVSDRYSWNPAFVFLLGAITDSVPFPGRDRKDPEMRDFFLKRLSRSLSSHLIQALSMYHQTHNFQIIFCPFSCQFFLSDLCRTIPNWVLRLGEGVHVIRPYHHRIFKSYLDPFIAFSAHLFDVVERSPIELCDWAKVFLSFCPYHHRTFESILLFLAILHKSIWNRLQMGEPKREASSLDLSDGYI